MLHSILQKIGLHQSEAEVYLACLKLGTQQDTLIARETKLSRAEVKTILKRLIQRGFVSTFKHGQKEFHTAEEPGVILKLLEHEKANLEQSIRDFKGAVHLLAEFIQPGKSKPDIAYYEGRKGIIAAYEDTLTAKSEILAISSIDDMETSLPQYMRQYYKRRKTAGIPIRAIFPDTLMARKRQMRDAEELRLSRLISPSLMGVRVELNIYDDKVAYFSAAEELAVIVRSEMISGSMRAMFQLCWKMADALSKPSAKPSRRPRQARRKRA